MLYKISCEFFGKAFDDFVEKEEEFVLVDLESLKLKSTPILLVLMPLTL